MSKDSGKEPLVRFSVAVGGELLERFDDYCHLHRYANRSEAVRGLMRSALIAETVASDNQPAMGVVTLIYDHHAGQIGERLTELQHDHLEKVVTTTHVHLDHSRCLEVILLRGRAREVRLLADSLIGTKGVEMGKLVLAGANPPEASPIHEHDHDHPHPHSHGSAKHKPRKQ
ncbi:MAG: nickel-responsive transcriptional regulator NikR [Planctomycetota bacterium]|nr:nickel-responsive transcriptional regulator NikR [Planctomycetota bacterium]RLT14442.1 MAG: nickel-responsive transcriptional regulator NikR [Planctomycetota bacterium]